MRGLAALARRASQARQAMVVRGGGGGPLQLGEPPTKPLAEQDELMWDDGTANPETCLDSDMVSTAEAAKWLLGALGVLGAITTLAWASEPEKRRPFAPKQLVPGAVPPEVLGRP